jgi:hypothetical protein
MNEVKNFTPIDLPLLRRLVAQGLSLEPMVVTQDSHPLEKAVLGAVGMTGRGRPTYLLRTKEGDYAAQMCVEETRARITLLAPMPEIDHPDSAWLALLENAVEQAGRRGAHLVTAEVPVESVAFEHCRRAGFTVYSRQNLFYLEAPPAKGVFQLDGELSVYPVQDTDASRLHSLYTNTVPRMVQQVDPPPNDWSGLIVMHENRLRGYIAVYPGKRCVLLQPYFHPELYDRAADVLHMAVTQMPAGRIYVRLLAYHEWLRRSLENQLGFVEDAHFALMARHTTVFVKESPAFSPLTALEAITFVPGVDARLDNVRSNSQLAIKNLTRWDIELPTTSKN